METQNIPKSNIFQRIAAKLNEIASQAMKIARDDPRKPIHSFKVGLALTIISLIYYLQPLYNNFGEYTMCAIITVVVVFEFSVGATLGKGLNRVLATLAAGALGIGAHHMAILTGKTYEPIFIAIFVFLLAVPSTFIRFFPRVKARYDYGMLVFILTFCLVSISGYRTDQVVMLAKKRLLTIFLGASVSVVVSIFIFPVWAGEDLHKLTAQNMDQLGRLMEEERPVSSNLLLCCLTVFAECIRIPEQAQTGSAKPSKTALNGIIVDSKSKEETLANFAKWEPGHGRFMYPHPWKQYLKIGHLTRQCGYRVQALNSFSNSSAQARQVIKLQGVIQEAFSSTSHECGKVLRELALAISTMTKPSSIKPHMTKLKTVAENMNTLLRSDTSLEGQYSNLLQIMPFAVVASLLIETVACVESIADAVNELCVLAKFKCIEKSGVDTDEVPSICITIEDETMIQSDALEHHRNNLLQIETFTCVEGISDSGVHVKFKCRENSGVGGEIESANTKNAPAVE